MLPSMREYFKPEINLFKETELQQVCIDTKEKIMQYDENSLVSTEGWQNHWVNYSTSIPHISKKPK